MPEPITSLVAQSSLPASGQVFSETLRLSILPARTVIRLQLGARSQKTVNSLKVAGRSMPVAINTWSGDDPVTLRIGPDTWLFHSAYHEAAELLAAIRAGCGRRSYAATDVSDSFVTIAVDGSQATALFERGCGTRSFVGNVRDFRLHAHAARAVAGGSPPRDVRAVRVHGGPVCSAVAVQLARGCDGRSGLTPHFT